MIIRLSLLLVGVLLAGTTAARSTTVDVALALDADDNLSRAEADEDRKALPIVSASVDVRHRRVLRQGLGVGVGARVESRATPGAAALNRIGLGGEGSVNWKPIAGYTAPFYAMRASAVIREHADSALRDGVGLRLDVFAGMRLSEHARARIGYRHDRRIAFDGRVFDLVGHGLFATASYRAARDLTVYLRHDLRFGDVVSTATPNAGIIAAARAIEVDRAFGAPDPARAAARSAYRLDGVSNATRGGFNLRLNNEASLDVSARGLTVAADGDNDYHSVSVSGALLIRFR